MSFLRNLVDRRAIGFQDVWGSGNSWSGGSASYSGARVTAQSSLKLVPVWACIRLLAESIASLPTGSFVRNGDVRESYPRPFWMQRPNPEQTSFTFWEQFMTSLLIYGNAYVYIVRADNTDVLELWVLHPDNVQPRRDGKNGALVYHVRDEVTGVEHALTPGYQILHVPAFSMPGSLVGLNPIDHARQAIGLGLGTEEFGGRFFAQGSTANVVLESEKSLTAEVAKRTAESWKKAHSGLKNSHFPAVLEGGITAKPLTIPNNQAQFLETRGFQRSDIAMFFRVPPHMIGDTDRSTSWGSGIESLGIGFVVYSLTTWIERIEQAATILFPPGSRAFMKFNVGGLLRGDTKSRYEGYSLGLNNGWLSIDEVRALEDRPPLPNGKGAGYRQPLNMGPVGDPTPGKQGTS